MSHTATATGGNRLDSRVKLERPYPFPAAHPGEPIVWWIVSGVIWLLPTLFLAWRAMALGWAGTPWWLVIATTAFAAVCIASFRHAARLHAARSQAQRQRARMERTLDALQGQNIVRASARVLHLWMVNHPEQMPRDGEWFWEAHWATIRGGMRPVSFALHEVCPNPAPRHPQLFTRRITPRFPDKLPDLAHEDGGFHIPAHLAAPTVLQADWEEVAEQYPVVEVRIGPFRIDSAHQRMALIVAIDARHPDFLALHDAADPTP